MSQVSHLLPRTCKLYRRTRTTDSGGGWLEDYGGTPIATGIPYRRSSPSARDVTIALQNQVKVSHAGFFDTPAELTARFVVGVDAARKKIEQGDRLVDEADNAVYDVQFALPPSEPEFQKWMLLETVRGN